MILPLNTTSVFILVHDLRYEGKTVAREVSRAYFYNMKRYDGNFLKERCSHTLFKRQEFKTFRDEYNNALMQKYNVSASTLNSRYFQEQVRPTL